VHDLQAIERSEFFMNPSSLSWILLLTLAATPTRSGGREQAAMPVDLSFTVYSESMEPVSGARVKLDVEHPAPPTWAAPGFVLTASSDGHTPRIPSAVGTRYDVHLKERSLPYGTLLGQSIPGYVVPPPTLDLSSCQVRIWETILTQPALRPVVVDSTAHLLSSPADELWSIDIDQADHDVFSFPALIGSLSTAESVDAYFDYCSVAPLEPDYRYALAIRTEEVESFGSYGAVIVLDCSSFGFSQEPVVDICFVATSVDALGETTLSIVQTNWTGGELRLSVSGSVGIGTTLLLVRPPGSGSNGIREVLADPPTFGPATSPRGPVSGLQAQRCTPPTPAGATAGECTPPAAPATQEPCPPPTKCGPATVTSDIRTVGPTICGNGGPTTEVGETLDWGASLSAKFDVGGVEITAGGNLKRTESIKTQTTPGSGTGCGECKQIYKIRALCKQAWTREVPSYGFFYPHPFRGCKDKKATTGSVKEIVQETSCPMTGC
jgi:hypothetical protein